MKFGLAEMQHSYGRGQFRRLNSRLWDLEFVQSSQYPLSRLANLDGWLKSSRCRLSPSVGTWSQEYRPFHRFSVLLFVTWAIRSRDIFPNERDQPWPAT